MDVFLLGAGRPASGKRPAALKYIAENTRALDWQIHSFERVASPEDIHFLGGYHVEEVIQCYPHLNVTVVPDWEQGGVLRTLSKAPYSGGSVLLSYSDTVFRPGVIEAISESTSDVVYAVDSAWEHRYSSRTKQDIEAAETIGQGNLSSSYDEAVEFTGLIYLSPEAAKRVFSRGLDVADYGLLELIESLESTGFSIKPFDVAGEWAEFNSPDDIARFILGTKADTLARLAPLVSRSKIGKQVAITAGQWRIDRKNAMKKVQDVFSGRPLVVRSSSNLEDNWVGSNAGGFESILDVDSDITADIEQAIESVLASYGEEISTDDQVLIQEFIGEVQAAGVVFTCSLETGSPYYRFNFDDKTSSTDSVTSGAGDQLRTVVLSRFAVDELAGVEPKLIPVFEAVRELEQLLGFDKLDIEFAVGLNGLVHIFQVRPITVDHSSAEIGVDEIADSLQQSAAHFRRCQTAPPQIVGNRTLFANMPDWNPAEIIGTRPRPLAFSVYRYLIADEVWASQRREYGYRDTSPQPLISMLSGQPYVDVRASLNSFVPARVAEDSAARLVDAYIEILAENPEYHDKIEFDVAFTIWTPDFQQQAADRLKPHGVTDADLNDLEAGLIGITRNALQRLADDIGSIDILAERRGRLIDATLAPIDKYYAVLEDCRRYGTLAFSHAARAGFVATTILRWLVRQEFLAEARLEEFLRSFSTVAGEFEEAKQALSAGNIEMSEIVASFGHLRPGTYDITQRAYWEDHEKYFSGGGDLTKKVELRHFDFNEVETAAAKDFLTKIDSQLPIDDFFEFLKRAIQAREGVKFEFSKNLSLALDAACSVGEELGLNRESVSYLCHEDLVQLGLNQIAPSALAELIRRRQRESEITSMVELPPLIASGKDIFCFERMAHQPNFVTTGRVEAEVGLLEVGGELRGKIVVIPQADPGFDWLFGQGISGLITQYGGANSHMAIRAAEIGLPAAIGVGERLYESISQMEKVLLDCANQIIRKIQ